MKRIVGIFIVLVGCCQLAKAVDVQGIRTTQPYTIFTSTFANVAASQTDSVVLAGNSGQTVCILEFDMVSQSTGTTVTINDKPSGSGTAISPAYPNGANGGIALNGSGTYCLFKSNQGDGISVTTGAGSQQAIHFVYTSF